MKQRNRSKLKRENVSPKILTAIFCAGRIRETFEIVKSKIYIYIYTYKRESSQVHSAFYL